MSAYRGAFLHRINSSIPFIGDYVIVHESALEDIQGGTIGEHYHVTEAEHSFITELAAEGIKVYEPLSIAGELYYDGNGEVMMAWGGDMQ